MNPRLPQSGRSTHGGLSRKREAEFLSAAARVLRTGFPNTERFGCLSLDVLQALARKKPGAAETEAVFEHLTCCSPCFAEYESLVRKERIARNLKILALCASLLLTVGLAFWFYVFGAEPQPRQPKPPVAQQAPPVVPPTPPIQYEVAVIDLRNRSPVRGDQQPGSGEPVVASLPARPVELTVYLPIGSEEDRYELQILRTAEAPLHTWSGSATRENRNIVLRLRADLTGLPPGRYLLGLRKASFRRAYYPLTVFE